MKIRFSARAYLVLLMASIAVAFGGMLALGHQNRMHDARAQALGQAALLASIAAKGVDAMHSDLLAAAQDLASRPEALAALSGQGCGAWLAEEAASRRLSNIVLSGPRGEPACSAIELGRKSAPSRSFLTSAAASRGAVSPFFEETHKSWAFANAYPVAGPRGKPLGSIALVSSSERLRALRPVLGQAGSEVSYVDAAGREGFASSAQNPSRSGASVGAEAREALAGSGEPKILSDGSFAASFRSPLSGWAALAWTPADAVFIPLSDGIARQTGILGAFCFLALLAIGGIASRLSAATSVLVKAAGNAESLFSSRSTGISEVDRGLDHMRQSSRERAKARETIELWRSASERTRSGMAVLRKTSRPGGNFGLVIELCNPAFEQLSGMGSCLGKDALRDAASMSLLGERAAAQEMRACARSGARASRPGHGMDAQGRMRHALISLEPLSIEGASGLFCLTLEDVTEIAEREAQLELQSTTDALTSLPNRALFINLLAKSIDFSQRDGAMCAVALLDLDHFKFVNDSIGHEMGDKVIAEVAQRLQAKLRPGDTLSRLGGDEFGIVFADAPNLETIASLVEGAREALERPVDMASRSFALTFSAGVAVFPADGDTPQALMSGAEVAVFQAKEHGRGQVKFHSKGMSEAFSERLIIEQALKAALGSGAIQFLYQPKISLATGQPCGMEALARWRDPVLGDVSPAKFIPLAEESELIETLGDLAIRAALRDAKTLWDQGFRNMPVAVNVSARQIKDGFSEKLLAALNESGLPAQAVHVEITESSVMPNSDATQRFLSDLSRLGIKVALDDFGTGWSNMAMLKTLPLSYLKMDRSFIVGLGKDEKDAAIAKAIIGLAKALGVEVIAEGVETHMQAQQLVYLQADQIQGYYVCRPMPIEDVSAWLHAGSVFQGAAQAGPARSGSIAPLTIQGPESA
jgi:diguanylate cyclase (GGDEF)-like protein